MTDDTLNPFDKFLFFGTYGSVYASIDREFRVKMYFNKREGAERIFVDDDRYTGIGSAFEAIKERVIAEDGDGEKWTQTHDPNNLLTFRWETPDEFAVVYQRDNGTLTQDYLCRSPKSLAEVAQVLEGYYSRPHGVEPHWTLWSVRRMPKDNVEALAAFTRNSQSGRHSSRVFEIPA